jgi:hypothetical protein
MSTGNSGWLAAHGKLWYDDRWYRLAWLAWPQALAIGAALWFWAMPSAGPKAQMAQMGQAAPQLGARHRVTDATGYRESQPAGHEFA